MPLPTITVSYPQTAVKSGTPVSGTLTFTYFPATDTLDAWVRIPDGTDPKAYLKGEVQADPGIMSEVGKADIHYMNFTRYGVPSRVRLRRFKARWLEDLPYAASIIAGYFGVEAAPIRQHLAVIG